METVDDPALQRYFVRTRGALGIRIVGLREARREVLAALGRGEPVGIVGDRDLTGGDPYFAAAGSGSRWVDSLVRADLRELVADSDLVGLDSLNGSARGDWLRDFWRRRDQGDLRHPGERLAEHYRRMWYARRNFRLVSPRRQYRIEERYRSYSRDYDDRGLIYLIDRRRGLTIIERT